MRYARGGGGGLHIFLMRMYPVKTKGEPKAGAGFLTNYQPKSGANHICYKNATQSRGNLVSVQIDIQCVSNIVEIMVLPPSKHACYIVLSILWWETGRENGSRTTHVPTPGRFFYFEWKPNPTPGLGRLCKPIAGGGGVGCGYPDPLTNTSHPPPPPLSEIW